MKEDNKEVQNEEDKTQLQKTWDFIWYVVKPDATMMTILSATIVFSFAYVFATSKSEAADAPSLVDIERMMYFGVNDPWSNEGLQTAIYKQAQKVEAENKEKEKKLHHKNDDDKTSKEGFKQ